MWETQRNLSIENIYLQNSEIEELIEWIGEREKLREGKGGEP